METLWINFESLSDRWEVKVTNEKSYTKKYLEQIFKLCQRKKFFYEGWLTAGENTSRLIQNSSWTTFDLILKFSTKSGGSWIAEKFKLTLSTDSAKNKIVIEQKCSFENMETFSFQVKGSDKVVYTKEDLPKKFNRLKLCANALCSFIKGLNDDLIQQTYFGISITPLPQTDNMIGKLMSQGEERELFTFFCEEENSELSISSSYLTKVSPVFEKFYNPSIAIGLAPTNRRKLKISKYCLEIIFKKIIFNLSFSDVDFHQIHEGDFFELLSVFCEFQMEFTYPTLVSLFTRLNISPGERSRILSSEFPRAIKRVAELL